MKNFKLVVFLMGVALNLCLSTTYAFNSAAHIYIAEHALGDQISLLWEDYKEPIDFVIDQIKTRL